MKEEDKQLLLQDLCARLPYGVMVEVSNEKYFGEIKEPYITELRYSIYLLDDDSVCIKPYLRPMSSMTEEERKEWFKQSHVDYDCEFKPEPTLLIDYCHLSIDWLNRHHFDYRGLIEKGLALPAPEDIYEID